MLHATTRRGWPPARALMVVLVATIGLGPAPARAAGLTEVAGFGSNPGNLRMFTVVPDDLAAGAPLVVAMHGCTQSASAYDDETGWAELAERWGFALVLPEQRTTNHSSRCFTWFEDGDTSRGVGEPLSVVQMVDWMQAQHGTDPDRVFVTGLSAGGAMTAVMLATYPDRFAGGGIVAGLPYRCARSEAQAWSCMNPGVDRSPAAWGAEVRAASSHTGPWPRVSIWHGTSDTTVRPLNATEGVDQWTDVHGIDRVADVQDSVAGHPRRVYTDAAGASLVEIVEVAGMGHGQPVDPGPGEEQCGTAGAYVLDADVCAAHHLGRWFGIAPGGGDPPPPPPPPPGSPGFEETFSDLDDDGDWFDTSGWDADGFGPDPADHTGTGTSQSARARAVSGTGCVGGAVTERLSRSVTLGDAPRLEYARRLDLRARVNQSTWARFRVSVDGAVVDEVLATYADHGEATWQVNEVDLAAHANRTVDLAFEVAASSNVCLEVTAEAWVDDVLVGSGGGGGEPPPGPSQLDVGSDLATDGYVKADASGGGATVGTYESSLGLAVGRGSDGRHNRTLLSFDTSALPDDAVVTRAWLTLQGRSGAGDPWSDPPGNSLVVDVRTGCFGAVCGTEPQDWGAAADVSTTASLPSFASGAAAMSSDFSTAGLAAIDATGWTQLRLRFTSPPGATAYRFVDNGDGATLHLEYTVP